MFKQAINTFMRAETVPLIKYVETHTSLVERQFKFYNALIVFGGSFIVWSIDRERTHVDKRFEQVDKRFEQVDKRFEQVDKRFEQVDKRLETIESDLKEIKNLFLVSKK
jgi:septal ring factor EnvC (AmiA/AmiB activator)